MDHPVSSKLAYGGGRGQKMAKSCLRSLRMPPKVKMSDGNAFGYWLTFRFIIGLLLTFTVLRQIISYM